jgi:uncharacterized lipoprotein NlpE involved in copper resistance
VLVNAARIFVVLLLAACDARARTTAPIGDTGERFCCSSLDSSWFVGEGCVRIDVEDVDTCANVLACGGTWKRTAEGQVVCDSVD